jgi:hypothetical protein
VALVALLALLAGLINVGSAGGPVAATAITVRTGPGRPIPAGFLGLSLEYPAVPAYTGSDQAAIDPAFVRLVRQLTPGQRPVLRIGGDSADWSWWPVAGAARPPGATYTLNDHWLAVTAALVRKLHARLILGLGLEANSPALAAAEARALAGGLPSGSVIAFQPGNEPELYGSFPWYRTAQGAKVRGRPRDYSFAAFMRDFSAYAAALGGVALAGPSTGGLGWRRYLAQFLSHEPQVKIVDVHRYPLQLCFTHPSEPDYPTVAHLLAPAASTGLADTFRAEVALAHARGLPLRIDELNTVSCGADRSVSQTFASALWALDTLFAIARVGVDGVNVHTFPGAGYELFRFVHTPSGWRASVAPEYDGLRMFAQAAPVGARLLRVVGAGLGGSLTAWATSTPDGDVRTVVINKSTSTSRRVAVRIPGGAARATVEQLTAPSAAATSGVALRSAPIKGDGGVYRITLPAASAVLLTAAAPTSAPTPRPRAAASRSPQPQTPQ